MSARYLIDKCQPDTAKKLLTSLKSEIKQVKLLPVRNWVRHFSSFSDLLLLLLLLLAVDPQTYEVTMRSGGSSDQKAELLTCPAARKLTLAQRYFLF